MRSALAPTLLILSAAAGPAAPPVLTVTPPAPAKGQAVVVSSSAPAKFDVRGASHLASPDGKSVIFFAPGTPVAVYAAAADPAPLAGVAVAVVGGSSPPAPSPTPPKPNPPTPPPTDPLSLRLKAAYDADAVPADPAAKAEVRKDLAELYRQAVPLCGQAEYATGGQLMAKVRAAANALAPDALKGVRTQVGKELAAVLTDPDAAMTAETRRAAADLFGRLALALDSFGG